MRALVLFLALAGAAGLAVFVWWSSGDPPIHLPGSHTAAQHVARTDGPRTGGPTGPTGTIAGGDVAPKDTGKADAGTQRVEGEPVSQFSKWVRDTREDHIFHHVVNGQDVPEDIRSATNMTAAEAKTVANVLRDEDARLASALRAFTTTLTDFKPTPEEVAAGDAYRLFQMVTGHQGMYLEMAPFFQNMDDDIQRRFYEERRPWSEFFDADSTVIRLCHAVHTVRAESYQKMREGGVDTDTLDKLQARYLLPGHFRYPGNNRFEFGPALK